MVGLIRIKVLLRPSSLSPCSNSRHHQLQSNSTSHRESNFIPRGESPMVCFVGFRPGCKGPWGGVEKEKDTHLEELTI